MTDITLIILLIVIGIAVGTVVSMVGLGGGVFFIPLLILVYAVDPAKAVGTSVFCMTLTNLSATIGYWRKGNVDYKLAIAYDIFDIPGIILGAYLTVILPGLVLAICCGIAIIIMGLMVIFKKSKPMACELPEKKTIGKQTEKPKESITENKDEPETAVIEEVEKGSKKIDYSFAWKGENFKWVVISSFIGGLMTGMVGLGGGTVDTTTMILLGVPTQMAAGSSSFAMLLTNAFGAGTHAILGNILWMFAIPLGIGTLIGAQIGCTAAHKINGNILRKILGIVAITTGIRLLFS